MTSRSFALAKSSAAMRLRASDPSRQITENRGATDPASASASATVSARVCIARRWTVRFSIASVRGSTGASPATKRTSILGCSSSDEASRCHTVARPWRVAAIDIVSSSAPSPIWLPPPSRS